MKSYDKCFYIIETDEENPKIVAVVSELPVSVADEYRVRAQLFNNAFYVHPRVARLFDGNRSGDDLVEEHDEGLKPRVDPGRGQYHIL